MKQVLYRSSRISYHRYLSGKDLLVTFHGYSQTGSEYPYFEDIMNKHFTIIAIDFWHGDNVWLKQEGVLDEDMLNIVNGMAYQEDLHA